MVRSMGPTAVSKDLPCGPLCSVLSLRSSAPGLCSHCTSTQIAEAPVQGHTCVPGGGLVLMAGAMHMSAVCAAEDRQAVPGRGWSLWEDWAQSHEHWKSGEDALRDRGQGHLTGWTPGLSSGHGPGSDSHKLTNLGEIQNIGLS